MNTETLVNFIVVVVIVNYVSLVPRNNPTEGMKHRHSWITGIRLRFPNPELWRARAVTPCSFLQCPIQGTKTLLTPCKIKRGVTQLWKWKEVNVTGYPKTTHDSPTQMSQTLDLARPRNHIRHHNDKVRPKSKSLL